MRSPSLRRPTGAPAALNTLTDAEKAAGWTLLFDGQTTNGWRSARAEVFPAKGWLVRDGILTVLASDGHEGGVGGDIITVDKYSNFDLKADFMITPGCNSGIKIFVDPTINKGPGSSIGLEYQILDDDVHREVVEPDIFTTGSASPLRSGTAMRSTST